jgi:UDP-glucose 4-epimerase
MLGVVSELPAWLEHRSLPDDAIPDEHQLGSIVGGHNPFAPLEGDLDVGVVVDADEVDEGVRLVGHGDVPVDQAVDGDPESIQFHRGAALIHAQEAGRMRLPVQGREPQCDLASRGFSRHADGVDTRRVVVTGGAGFIGSHLVERLLAAGEQVVVIDDLSTGSWDNLASVRSHPGLERVESTVSAWAGLGDTVASAKAVFHLAAAVGVELVVQAPRRTIEINLRETEAVLDAASKARTPVVFTSTSEVYGKSDKPWFSEEDDLLIGPPTLSRWSYACSKLLDEFLALACHGEQGVPVVIARLFNIVGPRQSGRHGMVLPRFVSAARAGQPLRVFGDGRQTRCLCRVQDCVEALLRLWACPAAAGQIVNIGHDEEISILDLAQVVISELGSASTIDRVPYEAAYQSGFQDMPRRRPDLRKLERLTGFRPRAGVRDVVRQVAGLGPAA